MSLTLIKYPVTIESGKVFNIFAGFQPVEIEFKREDITTFNVSSGVDNKILIEVVGDITSNLNIGEWVYLYAIGNTFIYDNSYKIIDLSYSSPNTGITVDGDFIEIASDGYLNYKQNYFVEAKIVDVSNNAVKLYPYLINDDGTASGVVKINVSGVVDYLNTEILQTSGQVNNNANRFKIMYREVYRENTGSAFVLLNQTPIIITRAAENSDPEKFVSKLETPKIWAGYPFNMSLLHSPENSFGLRLKVLFDQLDINQDVINSDNSLFSFIPNLKGFGQICFNDNQNIIDSNTKYIQFNLNSANLPDYDSIDYDSNDYLTD